MNVESNSFIPLAGIAIGNADLQAAVRKGTGNAHTRRLAAMYQSGTAHGDAMRALAAEAKRRALRKLPELLELAEKRLTENGVIVLWAEDGDEARRHVSEIVKRHAVSKVTKAKSMLSEEIALNPHLESEGVTVVETDLGEYIIKINHEHPSHIIARDPQVQSQYPRPVRRKTRDAPTDDAGGEMVAFARKKLRPGTCRPDMGISGGNFIIAETGTLALVTNEGNGRLCTSMPRVHVALVGIEKVIETVEDYAALTQVLPRSGTGQLMPVYTSMIHGPRKSDDSDGPEHVYVILVDNGRSKIYATKYAEVLSCIRCGACQNACPVYRSTGGHAYGWVYGGPIGAVLTPLLVGLDNAVPRLTHRACAAPATGLPCGHRPAAHAARSAP
ncbi:MAG: lactate utilization protein [Chloroflexi bacterium]|nr:lactate utilization protein [Chloroflexota bacterium]